MTDSLVNPSRYRPFTLSSLAFAVAQLDSWPQAANVTMFMQDEVLMDASAAAYPLRFHPAIGVESSRFRRLDILLQHYRNVLADLTGPLYVLLPAWLSAPQSSQLQSTLKGLCVGTSAEVIYLHSQPDRYLQHWPTLQQQLDKGLPLSLLAFDSPVPAVASHLLGGTACEGLIVLSLQPATAGLTLGSVASGFRLLHSFSEGSTADTTLLRQCLATSTEPLHHLLPPAGCQQQAQWLDLYEHISHRAADALKVHHPEQAFGELGSLQLPYRLLYLQHHLHRDQQALMLDMTCKGHRCFSLWHNTPSPANALASAFN